MNLSPPQRRQPKESIVPMINVVFLLLIFFLMTAQIVTPDPIEITLPETALEGDADPAPQLVLGADGTLAMGTLRDDAVIAALASLAAEGSTTVMLRADHRVPAALVAALLPRLGAAGISDVKLMSRGQ